MPPSSVRCEDGYCPVRTLCEDTSDLEILALAAAGDHRPKDAQRLSAQVTDLRAQIASAQAQGCDGSGNCGLVFS